ncbi:protein of unknown function [Xenorhabdus poinarii G6]|uniref:Uncharacterized protein n=1 Tax=Xenorhabdus poinarii G6 TaxID=1354304 RepID=A0A068R759_9GAMM|nr:protein of unknown function [Xenorhabdus poinarii G6]
MGDRGAILVYQLFSITEYFGAVLGLLYVIRCLKTRQKLSKQNTYHVKKIG